MSRTVRLRVIAALVVLVGVVSGCQAAASPSQPGAGASTSASTSTSRRAAPVVPATPARTAASARIRFRPTELVLPGGLRASVQEAQTVKGTLAVPEDVRRVGWWDGSAYAGDPFGSTVLAGHVDSRESGVGVLARLLRISRGATITLRGDGHRATYRVVNVKAVDKDALATRSGAFDQRGPHRLVLITCTGRFDAVRGSYEQNLVVVAEPAGPVR